MDSPRGRKESDTTERLSLTPQSLNCVSVVGLYLVHTFESSADQ